MSIPLLICASLIGVDTWIDRSIVVGPATGSIAGDEDAVAIDGAGQSAPLQGGRLPHRLFPGDGLQFGSLENPPPRAGDMIYEGTSACINWC